MPVPPESCRWQANSPFGQKMADLETGDFGINGIKLK
jgi:hypothetical protein